jgi:hypothetical protein
MASRLWTFFGFMPYFPLFRYRRFSSGVASRAVIARTLGLLRAHPVLGDVGGVALVPIKLHGAAPVPSIYRSIHRRGP